MRSETLRLAAEGSRVEATGDFAHRNSAEVERQRRRLWELRATGTITEVESLSDVAHAARQMRPPEDLREKGETPVRMTAQLHQAWLVNTLERRPVEGREVLDDYLRPMGLRSTSIETAAPTPEDPAKAFMRALPEVGDVARVFAGNHGPLTAALVVSLRREIREALDALRAVEDSLPGSAS